MSKYTKIFTTPYVPKYGPVPLSEIGQMMKERKQVIDQSILQDEKTQALIDVVGYGADSDELELFKKTISDDLAPLTERIQSGDYNTRDIELQTQRTGIRVGARAQAFQALKEQKTKDIENFFELNKDADPQEVGRYYQENKPKIILDEETGNLTLSGGLGMYKLPEMVSLEDQPFEEGEYYVEPTRATNLFEETDLYDFDRDDLTIREPRERKAADPMRAAPTDYRNYPLSIRQSEADYVEKDIKDIRPEDLDSIKNETAKTLAKKIASTLMDENGNPVENFGERFNVAINRYLDDNDVIKGVGYKEYSVDKQDDVMDKYITNGTIMSKMIFIPSTGERMPFSDFIQKYKGAGYVSEANIKGVMTLQGEITEDLSGIYTEGIVGTIINKGGIFRSSVPNQFIILNETASAADQERNQALRQLSGPADFRDINLKRYDADKGRMLDIRIVQNFDTKDAEGNSVFGDRKDSAYDLSYEVIVTDEDGNIIHDDVYKDYRKVARTFITGTETIDFNK